MNRTSDTKADIRLARLQEDMDKRADVCSSGGVIYDFPQRMYEGFINFGIGLIVCHEGDFEFILSDNTYTARQGETVFITENTSFRIVRRAQQLRLSIIIYKTEPIRYVIGTMVQSVQIYAKMSPELPCVWTTGCENDISEYISLIGSETPQPDNLFAVSEHKMLLMSLTYRLCTIFSNKFFADASHNARRTEVFLKLIYNPQIQIFAESETKRPFFECSFKTKRTKKGLAHNTNNKARNKSQNHSISGFGKHNSTGNIIAFK